MASRVGLLALGAFGLNEVKAAAAALSHRSFGTGHSLKDVLIAASEDDADAEEKPLTKHQDFSRLEDIADANDAVDAQEMSRKVADLEAKLQTMKKMAMLQTAETKATMTSLEERLPTAEEQAAESQGELEVSEAHAKDLEQQLIKEMARRRKAEEQLHPEPFSFLQLSASEAEEIAEMKKELADVKSKISKERREGQLTQEKLMASSRQVEATQKKLKKLQEAKKRHPGKAAKKTPVVAMGKKVGAARQELAQLKVQRQELRKQLRDQQEALDHVNLDVKRHSEHVEQLKSRSHDLQEMMKNMQLAYKKQLKQATAESHRIQKMFASVDQELQKARAKKAQLDAKVAQVAYERKKEEQRAKNEESEAKTIGAEADQAENELHQVKQEITKLNVEIFQEQQKAQAAEKTMREEQQKYQEELKTKQLREEQVQKMMALLTTKDEAMTSLEGRFSKLQRKAKAAQQLLDKEEKKAELQEQAAQKQLENERKQAEKIEKEETLKLQKVKQQLEEEAEKARKAFDDQVQLMRKRNDKEVQEEKHKIEQKVTLEQHQIMEKVGKLKKELSREQDRAKKQALEASKKEDQLRQKLKKTKQEEDLKVERSHQKMQELELSLEKQREVSNEKVNKAKMKLQKLQEEVIGEEEALGTKKLELQRVLREAKDMESRAKTQEAAESQEAKLKAASVMEHKGKTALQRQAEHEAAELQKLIVQQKEMEQKQVSALEKQIKATQAKSPKFLSAFTLQTAVCTLEYSNRWTVQIDGDKQEADKLAKKYGFLNLGKVVDNYYSFQQENMDSMHLHQGLFSDPKVKMVERQELKSYSLRSSLTEGFYVNDPRWEDMWYINGKNGQPTYNVIDVWKRNITGEGVVVAVVDRGLDPEHPELRDNYDSEASFDLIDNDKIPLPQNKSYKHLGHGENCAGIIAAVLNNSFCGVGLAFKASIGGIRLFYDGKASDADEARALSYALNHIDIYSNSWGPNDLGFAVAGPGFYTQRVLQDGVEKGRRGLGSIYVFAAGNGGIVARDSCSFDGYVNSIYTIAITGVNSDGSVPGYGEPCAGIMAVTFSGSKTSGSSLVITADKDKTCTDNFSSSSAAAAMASGLIALMLSANRELTWRDVQHIIVRTARPEPLAITGSSWNTNKAGLKANDYVGFGLMDATKMVDFATNWTRVPPKVRCAIQGPRLNRPIPSQGHLEETIDLSEWSDLCGDVINHLEHVEVSVNLTYTLRGELLIRLMSPEGTVSNLTHYRVMDSAMGSTDLNWVLMTLHHWGESAPGIWRLTLGNSDPSHDNTGTLFNWTLILHGTNANPLHYNPHVSTTTVKPSEAKTTPTHETPRIPTTRTPLLTEARESFRFTHASRLKPIETATQQVITTKGNMLLTEARQSPTLTDKSSLNARKSATRVRRDSALIIGLVVGCLAVVLVGTGLVVVFKKKIRVCFVNGTCCRMSRCCPSGDCSCRSFEENIRVCFVNGTCCRMSRCCPGGDCCCCCCFEEKIRPCFDNGTCCRMSRCCPGGDCSCRSFEEKIRRSQHNSNFALEEKVYPVEHQNKAFFV